MKASNNILIGCRKSCYLMAILFVLLPAATLRAQQDTAQKDDPAESATISPTLTFKAVQKNNHTIGLNAILKAKVNGNFLNLRRLKISFVQVTDEAEVPIGFAITNEQGNVNVSIKADSLKPNKEGNILMKAVFAGNKQMDAVEEETAFKRAAIDITAVADDSVKSVKLRMTDIGSENKIPIKDMQIGLYVQRYYNPLKIGEATTDENGEAIVEVPRNLPGDAKGNISLLAKLDDNELYGNVEASIVQKWGTPVSDKVNDLPRGLWGAHPPMWMIVTFVVLMVTVWGHYIVIIYELFRLRKEAPAAVDS